VVVTRTSCRRAHDGSRSSTRTAPASGCESGNKRKSRVAAHGLAIDPDEIAGINSHQASLPTGGPHSSSEWRFSGLMPAISCANVQRRFRRFDPVISTTSLPSRTSMLAVLPTLAPISCANGLGTRSAKLLPLQKLDLHDLGRSAVGARASNARRCVQMAATRRHPTLHDHQVGARSERLNARVANLSF
jgi:hypothetical protein